MTAGNESVRVRVADTGIGIPEKWQPSVFDEFFRVKSSLTARIPGTGMGLAICRKIVDELGGRIALRSEPGSGSTFTVILPAWDKCPARQQGPPPSAAGATE